MGELTNRVALVTGASGGIGSAVALALAEEGAHLLLSGRDAARLEAIAERARPLAPRVEVAAADLAEDEAVRGLAAKVEELFHGLDMLVHATGAFRGGAVAASPVEDLDLQVRINLRLPYLLTQLLLPALRERQGQVVFVNSTAGMTAHGKWASYAASKHGLKALADSLREEVNRDGVRVLSVFPGRTASPMQEEVKRWEGKPYEPERLLQPADVAAMIVQALKLPRTAEVTNLQMRPMQGG
jgi:NAD(P)-dependent dehydrogenase (short-subunit alcohol dehydrogenase family)